MICTKLKCNKNYNELDLNIFFLWRVSGVGNLYNFLFSPGPGSSY